MADEDDVLERHVIHEVAAVFHREEILEDAMQALLHAGFDRSDIDLMGDIETVRRRLGALHVPPEEIAVPGAPRRATSPATTSVRCSRKGSAGAGNPGQVRRRGDPVHEIEIDKRLANLPPSGLKPDPWLGGEPLAHR